MKSINNNHNSAQLKKIYRVKKQDIEARLREFKSIWSHGDYESIFTELAFCILTPQSRAKSCWNTILELKKHNLLLKGSLKQIRKKLKCVRFHNKKAEYIVKAREVFMNNGMLSVSNILNRFANVYDCRDWLVKNIKGLGYKESSHFLRNIGFGENIAILDRHILKSLHRLGVLEKIPYSLSRPTYLAIEKQMSEYAKRVGIPISHLDLLLWFKETGEIFK